MGSLQSRIGTVIRAAQVIGLIACLFLGLVISLLVQAHRATVRAAVLEARIELATEGLVRWHARSDSLERRISAAEQARQRGDCGLLTPRMHGAARHWERDRRQPPVGRILGVQPD